MLGNYTQALHVCHICRSVGVVHWGSGWGGSPDWQSQTGRVWDTSTPAARGGSEAVAVGLVRPSRRVLKHIKRPGVTCRGGVWSPSEWIMGTPNLH